MDNLTYVLAGYAAFATLVQIGLLGFVWFDTLSRDIAPFRWLTLVLLTGPIGLLLYLSLNRDTFASAPAGNRAQRPAFSRTVNRGDPPPMSHRPSLMVPAPSRTASRPGPQLKPPALAPRPSPIR